eukprot:scaffold42387_cov14-Tisochrysis_lutea.AAC.1
MFCVQQDCPPGLQLGSQLADLAAASATCALPPLHLHPALAPQLVVAVAAAAAPGFLPGACPPLPPPRLGTYLAHTAPHEALAGSPHLPSSHPLQLPAC